ncbi:hypothetical protein D3C78_1598480 [compost metagenome]
MRYIAQAFDFGNHGRGAIVIQCVQVSFAPVAYRQLRPDFNAIFEPGVKADFGLYPVFAATVQLHDLLKFLFHVAKSSLE